MLLGVSSTVNRGRVKSKTMKLVFCCFSAKHIALRRKGKDWLAWNQSSVSQWSNMCTRGLLFQPYTPPLHQQYRPPLEKLKPWCTTTMYFKYVAYNSSQSHWVVTGVAGCTAEIQERTDVWADGRTDNLNNVYPWLRKRMI